MFTRLESNVAPHDAQPAATAAASHNRTGAERPAPPLIESNDLLQGGKSLGIIHNGALYRLQATRLGKLILTK